MSVGKRKKALVCGGSGFLGSHVADALTAAGWDVSVFDRCASLYLQKDQRMIVGDILDRNAVKESVRGMDVVYNFAGIAGIEDAGARPVDAVETNVLGNTYLLEACYREGVKRFVFASSLYVYGRSGSFYRTTKLACEMLIENYGEVYHLPYTILRYGSLYGPRADKHNTIRSFIEQALTEKKVTRFGDGEELREYIHVLDAARGSVEILAEEFNGQNVVLTGQQQIRVRDLLAMLKETFADKISIEFAPAVSNTHYMITPYAFMPKVGKRLVQTTYLDLGQGILDYIYQIAKELGHYDIGRGHDDKSLHS